MIHSCSLSQPMCAKSRSRSCLHTAAPVSYLPQTPGWLVASRGRSQAAPRSACAVLCRGRSARGAAGGGRRGWRARIGPVPLLGASPAAATTGRGLPHSPSAAARKGWLSRGPAGVLRELLVGAWDILPPCEEIGFAVCRPAMLRHTPCCAMVMGSVLRAKQSSSPAGLDLLP